MAAKDTTLDDIAGGFTEVARGAQESFSQKFIVLGREYHAYATKKEYTGWLAKLPRFHRKTRYGVGRLAETDEFGKVLQGKFEKRRTGPRTTIDREEVWELVVQRVSTVENLSYLSSLQSERDRMRQKYYRERRKRKKAEEWAGPHVDTGGDDFEDMFDDFFPE